MSNHIVQIGGKYYRFITNTYDISKPLKESYTLIGYHGETREQIWKNLCSKFAHYVIDQPFPTDVCSVDQLKKWDYVGYYEEIK